MSQAWLQSLNEDIKSALKQGKKADLLVLRSLLAEYKNSRIEKGQELTETEAIALVSRLVKQRKASIEQFQTANRQDLVDQEKQELVLLETYLPQPLTEDELASLIVEAQKKVGANLGAMMGHLRAQAGARVEGAVLVEAVKRHLGQ